MYVQVVRVCLYPCPVPVRMCPYPCPYVFLSCPSVSLSGYVHFPVRLCPCPCPSVSLSLSVPVRLYPCPCRSVSLSLSLSARLDPLSMSACVYVPCLRPSVSLSMSVCVPGPVLLWPSLCPSVWCRLVSLCLPFVSLSLSVSVSMYEFCHAYFNGHKRKLSTINYW